MNNKLNEIKSLFKKGEHAKAEDVLKSYCNQFSNDLDGKLMECLIAKLRSEEKTFRSIFNKAPKALVCKIWLHRSNALQEFASFEKGSNDCWATLSRISHRVCYYQCTNCRSDGRHPC